MSCRAGGERRDGVHGAARPSRSAASAAAGACRLRAFHPTCLHPARKIRGGIHGANRQGKGKRWWLRGLAARGGVGRCRSSRTTTRSRRRASSLSVAHLEHPPTFTSCSPAACALGVLGRVRESLRGRRAPRTCGQGAYTPSDLPTPLDGIQQPVRPLRRQHVGRFGGRVRRPLCTCAMLCPPLDERIWTWILRRPRCLSSPLCVSQPARS